MIKMKKLLAGLLSVTILSATAITSFAAENTVPTTDGTYTTNKVTAYKYDSSASPSMCNGVFAGEADIVVAGNTATLTLYVANPLPSMNGFADGILSNSFIYFNETNYTGDVTSIGFENANAITKLFTQDNTMFGITTGDVLACDAIVFTLPKEALLGGTSANGYKHSYIDLTTDISGLGTQKFYLDLAYVGTDSDSDSNSDSTPDTTPDVTPDDENTVYSTEISATVPVNASNYSVVVPETIAIGSLDFNEDTTYDYEVAVTVSAGNDGGLTVNVTPESEGTLSTEDSNATIALTNTLAKTTFTSSETANGTITVKASDVAGSAAGNYAGTINFTISAE